MVPYNILSCRMILRIISLTMFFSSRLVSQIVIPVTLSYIWICLISHQPIPSDPIASHPTQSHTIPFRPISSYLALVLHPIVCYLILSQDLQWYDLTLWPKNHLPARQPEPSKHAFSGISCHVISYNIISYHIMPYHISDHILSYSVILCHIRS